MSCDGCGGAPATVGPPGARGPAGPVGPVGPQGPAGEVGGIALSAAGGLISSGTASFANANGVSFGLVGQTVTASVGAGVTPPALSAGTQSANTGTFSFADSGGITFGMAGSQTITGDVGAIRTVSAGNGSSMGNIKRLDFSNAGGVSFGLSTAAGSTGTITGSVAAGATATGNVGALSAGTQSGSSGTFAFSNSNGLSFGMAGSQTITGSYSTALFSNANGVSFGTAGSTVTASIAAQSSLSFSNLNGVSFGVAGSTLTASVAGAPPALGYFDNMQLGASNSIGNLNTLNVAGADRSLKMVPFNPHPFPADMTLGTLMLDVSLSGSTATMALGFTYTLYFGLYTSTGGTLSLLNSASVALPFGINASNSDSLVGQRFVTVHSSLWSVQPVLTRGGQYFLGTVHSTSGVSMQSFTQMGQVLYSTGQRSGTVGGASATAATVGWSPFYGIYTASTAAMPVSIANSELNKTALGGRGFLPHVVLVNNTDVSVF